MTAEVVTTPGSLARQGAVGGSRLEASGLQKTYGSRKVVKDVSLIVRKGEVVGLLGPNGAGKSTLCSVAAGLVEATEGRAELVLLEGAGHVCHWEQPAAADAAVLDFIRRPLP